MHGCPIISKVHILYTPLQTALSVMPFLRVLTSYTIAAIEKEVEKGHVVAGN